MGRYHIGERVSWDSLNKTYSGEVIGFDRHYAVVRIDGSTKATLLTNEEPTLKNKRYDKNNGKSGAPQWWTETHTGRD